MRTSDLRHQCLIYDGAPSHHVPKLAAAVQEKLAQSYRCLYFDSKPMVAGLRSHLAQIGVDVAHETSKGSLILSSDAHHLDADQSFDMDTMIGALEEAIRQALTDGYAGLWASGDMAWEFGPKRDFSRLVEYERRLEELFRAHPEFTGICQYRTDILPPEAVQHGRESHSAIFINETLTIMNPAYLNLATS